MSEPEREINTVLTDSDESHMQTSTAYMNRLFCSTRERIGYILKTSFAKISLGQYDTDSDLFLYSIYKVNPRDYAKKYVWLGLYDMINDPLSAAIVDNMRTRWGKFKPFQYLALLPNTAIGLITCLLPLIAGMLGFGENPAKKLVLYMIIKYASETVTAFFSGGDYIDKVYTPNPNERTTLLVAAKFISEFFSKLPAQITGIVFDLVDNGVLSISSTRFYVIMKTFWWVVATIPGVYWIIVSRERVNQSEKPPNPWRSIRAVFQNKPLLIYTLSNMIGGIEVGTSESLYYREVLQFTMISTFGGIAGSPLSYVSYPLATFFRKKYSTKALAIMQSVSVSLSESLYFFTGLIGGKENGWYKKKIPMLIAYSIGNMIEMTFYGTKQIISDEINFEVLDYCEWKNGYRVEATVNLLSGYFNKLKTIILKIINANLLEGWAGYDPEKPLNQSDTTKWRMFLTACGPKLIFGYLRIIPLLFYNIDRKTRDQMYLDLEKSRAAAAARSLSIQNTQQANITAE